MYIYIYIYILKPHRRRAARECRLGQSLASKPAARFYAVYISDFYKINPWVNAYVCKDNTTTEP